MNASKMRAAAACALLATSCLAGPAQAQTVGDGGGETEPSAPRGNVSPPAEKFAISPGGVDMRTGQYAFKQVDLSVGDDKDESSGLALKRTMNAGVAGHINPFGNFSHNWDILLTEKRVSLFQQRYQHGWGEDYEIGIHFGGRSETFRAPKTATGFEQTSRSAFSRLTFTGDKASGNVVYRYEASDGTVVLFRPLGSTANADCSSVLRCAYASQVTWPDGTVFSFSYDSVSPGVRNSTRLRSVTSTRGWGLGIDYGAGNLVQSACVLNLARTAFQPGGPCPADAAASGSYSYADLGGAPKLAAFADPAGATWGYSYSGNAANFNMGFINPGEGAPWMTLGLSQRVNGDGSIHEIVAGQSFADGSDYSYMFEETPPVEPDPKDGYSEPPSIAGGSFSDALGQQTIVRYDFPVVPESRMCPQRPCAPINVGDILYQVTPGPIEIVDPLQRSTKYDYCDPVAMAGYPSYLYHRCLVGLLRSFTDPEGIRTELTYDAFRNVAQVRRKAKPGSTLPDGSPMPDIVTSSTFDCSSPKHCAKPASTTDAKGNRTDYAYSPDHGGVLTETGPAVNGVRPQKRYGYAQRYAWLSNGAGGYSPAASPAWVLTREAFCRTGAAVGNGCAIAGDEVVTTYDYGPDSGPNTLLLRGKVVDDGGLSLRTCYAYDARGNETGETSPRAGLTGCP